MIISNNRPCRAKRGAPPLTQMELASVIRRLHKYRWRSAILPPGKDGDMLVLTPGVDGVIYLVQEPVGTGTSGHTFNQ